MELTFRKVIILLLISVVIILVSVKTTSLITNVKDSIHKIDTKQDSVLNDYYNYDDSNAKYLVSDEDWNYILKKSKEICHKQSVNDLPKEFKDKAQQIAKDLGVSEKDLLTVIGFETGDTFCSCAVNVNSRAVGLIQFLPSTAKSLGTTSKKLCDMSEIDQLDLVYEYLKPYKSKIHDLGSLYMAILCPNGLNNKEIIFSKDGNAACGSSKSYDYNKGFDKNNDSKVTYSEVASALANRENYLFG
jgi:hypothetical protein